MLPGDPVRWSDFVLGDPRGPDLAGYSYRPGYGHELLLRLRGDDGRERLLTLPFRVGSPLPPVWPSAAPAAWGLCRLGPGIWHLMPSIVEDPQRSDSLHRTIVLVDVPEPPPFLRKNDSD